MKKKNVSTTRFFRLVFGWPGLLYCKSRGGWAYGDGLRFHLFHQVRRIPQHLRSRSLYTGSDPTHTSQPSREILIKKEEQGSLRPPPYGTLSRRPAVLIIPFRSHHINVNVSIHDFAGISEARLPCSRTSRYGSTYVWELKRCKDVLVEDDDRAA